ncbi:MAG: Uma2 family endonuclease [Cyanobacteria bacterium J06623_4]
MVQTPVKTLTLEEFLQLPETKPASEYIDGQVIQKPMPKAAHSVIQSDLSTAINSAIKVNKIGRALPELRCTFGGRSIVPDITVLPWGVIPRNENGKASDKDLCEAPHWMIEILSPGQSQMKIFKKIAYALAHGTQLAWLIDPTEECVVGYTPDLPAVLYEESDAQLPVPAFAADFQLTVGELIGWLYE